MGLLNKEQAEQVHTILSKRDVIAQNIMSSDYMVTMQDEHVTEVLQKIKNSGLETGNISYIYVVKDQSKTLIGVVDLRELVLAADHLTIADIMASPVVTAEHK